MQQHEVLQPNQLQIPKHVEQCSPGGGHDGHSDQGGLDNHDNPTVFGGHVAHDYSTPNVEANDYSTPNVEAMAEIFKNSESPPDAAMSGCKVYIWR